MVFFVTFLRALAACLITNAHYTGVYPTDMIANGGLLGDVLFFAVSGYCLYNVKGNFAQWYGKRLWRIYPPVLIMSALFILVGAYSLKEHNLFWWLLYPTCYHFVASILLLYIPFYICMKIGALKKHLLSVMLCVAAAWVLVYCVFYDKSYYHIDTVREPMIWFLFFESMLVGAWFRASDVRMRNRFKWTWLLLMVVMFVVYFASKLAFSKIGVIAWAQIANQFILLALLFLIFCSVCGLDAKLEKLPNWLKKCICFVAEITLEIYIVQYVLIDWLRNAGVFPINWLALTSAILVSAYLLHLLCKGIYALSDYLLKRFFSK